MAVIAVGILGRSCYQVPSLCVTQREFSARTQRARQGCHHGCTRSCSRSIVILHHAERISCSSTKSKAGKKAANVNVIGIICLCTVFVVFIAWAGRENDLLEQRQQVKAVGQSQMSGFRRRENVCGPNVSTNVLCALCPVPCTLILAHKACASLEMTQKEP